MIKNSKERVMISLPKKSIRKLEFIAKNTNQTKSKVLNDLINQKTSINKLWKEIDYEDLDEEDKIYYVKSLIENPYLENTSNKTITELKNISLKTLFKDKYILKDYKDDLKLFQTDKDIKLC